MLCRQVKVMLGGAILLALGSCSARAVHEDTFTLYLSGRTVSDLMKAADAVADQQGYELTQQTYQTGGPKTVNHNLLLEGQDIRSLIQSALAEKCIAREGRRDVEFS